MSIVIVAATDIEMTHLVEDLGCVRCEQVMGFDLYSGQHQGSDVHLIKSGPCMANAAAATAIAVERFHPKRIFNVGICGVYSDETGFVGRVVTGTGSVFADAGVKTDMGFQPLSAIDLPLLELSDGTRVFNIIELNDKGISGDILKGVFATVEFCSGSAKRAGMIKQRFKIEDSRLLCEDMESAAVGLIALRAGLPCSVLRGISNLCGERDHGKWKIRQAAFASQMKLLESL